MQWDQSTILESNSAGVNLMDTTGFGNPALLTVARSKAAWKQGPVASSALNYRDRSYNINFFDKYTTQKFYCSQLVWRAYAENGIDLDSNFTEFFGRPFSGVSPDDIIQSPHLSVVWTSWR